MKNDGRNMLPQHVAIIMDGNGRWAKARHLPRLMGHKAGFEAAKKIIRVAASRGIAVLSLFAFSTENWRRPAEEVGFLMHLFLQALQNEVNDMDDSGLRLRFIGNRDQLSDALVRAMDDAERRTKDNRGMLLQIAIDYGGRWDILQAVRRLMDQVNDRDVTASDLTESLFSSFLSFSDVPDPDLFIRTSGESRISNFMLWQLAYTELYFSPLFWPDFTEAALHDALTYFATRERRFGKVGEYAACESENPC